MDISYYRYGLKLREGTGGNARSARRVLEGFLIRADGGYGCVQPWPELGDETLEQQWQALRRAGGTRLLDRALECAAADALARREQRSLFDGIAVPRSHATVTNLADFSALKAEGFDTVKLKGGRDWWLVLEQMHKAIAAELRIRVDFNGVLGEADFLAFTREAEEMKAWVDFVEDPVPYVAQDWERLSRKTGWPLALDWVREGTEVTNGFAVRVLKPAGDLMSMGSERGLLTAPGCYPLVVVTSYMDHPLGQAFAAWEAGRYQGSQSLGGLLTHRLFKQDAFTDRLARVGPEWMSPGGTGLGFDDLLAELPWVSIGGSGVVQMGRVLQNPRDPLPSGGPVLEPGQIGFATSGSTGVPSVVVHTEQSLKVSAAAVNQWLGVTAEDVWLRVLPTFHVGGYQLGVRAGLAGSRVAMDEEKWEARRFARICEEERVTLSALVPTQVVDLVRLGLRGPEGLRALVVGGGALEETIRLAARALGWPVLASYGSTEAGSQVATERWEFPGGGLELLPCWEAQLGQEEIGLGGGRLALRGAALAEGRFISFDTTWKWQPLRDEKGWWQTADRVILTGRQLRFVGRMDRVVKVLGELVNLEAVERGLVNAGLEEGTFAVIAVPDERRGAELIVVSEITLGKSWLSCFEIYQEGAAPFARIGRRVVVEQLPRSALGKIKAAAVAALIPQREVPG